MKTVPRLFASKDAVRTYKTSVNVSDTYGVASKKTSLFKATAGAAFNVASLIRLAAFTSSHTAVILYGKLH